MLRKKYVAVYRWNVTVFRVTGIIEQEVVSESALL